MKRAQMIGNNQTGEWLTMLVSVKDYGGAPWSTQFSLLRTGWLLPRTIISP